MNSNFKLIFSLAALILLIGGSTLLYRRLQKNYDIYDQFNQNPVVPSEMNQAGENNETATDDSENETSLRKHIELIHPCEDESDDNTKSEYQKITADETKIIMDELDAYILLDVRTKEEYDEVHIDEAIMIPDTEIEHRADNSNKYDIKNLGGSFPRTAFLGCTIFFLFNSSTTHISHSQLYVVIIVLSLLSKLFYVAVLQDPQLFYITFD